MKEEKEKDKLIRLLEKKLEESNMIKSWLEKSDGDEIMKTIIESFSTDDILDNISSWDIAQYVEDNPDILLDVNDSALAYTIKERTDFLDNYSNDDLIEEFRSRNMSLLILEYDDSLINTIKSICKEISHSAYIDKEESKKILCDYIDTFVDKGF